MRGRFFSLSPLLPFSPSQMPFTKPLPIRFRHCDPAGIVFYPRYFEMLNDLVEDWFAELGWDFASLHGEKGEGIPTLKMEAEFLAPSRLGEELLFSLELLELGSSSFELAYSATCQNELRLKAKAKLVYISNNNDLKSTPIPTELRERMLPYLKEEVSK